MPSIQLSPDLLAVIAGALLSLAFSYIPGLSTGFAALKPEVKRLIMLALLLLVAVAVFLLGCYAILSAGIACTQAGAVQLAWVFALAVISNQSTYSISPQTASVKAAKPLLLSTASGEPVGPIIAVSNPVPPAPLQK